jgi:dipeptidyl aminopeptidase/acylaminoacyl peptidase
MMRHRLARRPPFYLMILALLLVARPLAAQQPDSTRLAADRAVLAAEQYVLPPPEIASLVTAPRYENVSLTQPSPDRRYFLKPQSEGLPDLALFGKPHYYFGGLQVDFRANRARTLTTRGATGLALIDATTGQSTTVETPAGASVSSPAWSPDGKQLAYIANFDDASYVYVADVATGKSRRITQTPLLATLVTTIDWTADGRSIVAVLLPANRGPVPVRPALATGPLVRLWMDSLKSPQRNFASLLDDPFDRDLMAYYVTGQLALIDVRTRAVKPIGAPAMFTDVDVSPDGQVVRVTTMQRPFSYVVQYNSFATTEELWDTSGKMLAEVAKRPLRLARDTSDTPPGAPGGRDQDAKRGLAWMPQGPGLYYLEAVPGRRGGGGGDSAGGAAPGGAPAGARGFGRGGASARPDRIMQWLPPFGAGDTTVLYKSDGPVSQVRFTDDGKTVFVATSANGTGEIFAVDLADPTTKHVVVRQRGYTPSFTGDGGRGFRGGFMRGGGGNDSAAFYTNPGAMVTRRGSRGGMVAMVSSDGAVYLQGTRYDPDWRQHAPRPFVDKVDLATGDKTRIFEGADDVAETLGTALDDDFTKVIVTRESPTEVPNAYLKDLKSGSLTKLTDNTDYTPEFTRAIRKRITVTRADGVRFLVDLTLPAGYQAGTRLPAMFWFYPREYTDQAGYDRTLRTENVHRFPTAGARTIEYLITQGYAVANFNPPIVGETGRMNDNYVSDLQMNLIAVIDELDRDGYIDRTRLGIGGHSYGAFSTANAMVHTPYFKAGIAGDGMYNRTLTPNGFQSERRDLWAGQKTYLDMSPFLMADKLQGALLMYHSLEDQNVGTDPISSIRMMQALRAYGKTAALFMYPYEDHGPLARETILDQWARWVAWLDIYVKHAGEAIPKPAEGVAADRASGAAPQ